jgi:AcrR family transcriptional regulator
MGKSAVSSGPKRGTEYVSADESRSKIIGAAIGLLESESQIHKISARKITEHAEVDKMYVNHFFGNTDNLWVSVLEHLLVSRMASLTSSEIFSFSKLNNNVLLAFRIYIHVRDNPDLASDLQRMTSQILAIVGAQMQSEFGLTAKQAEGEAITGLLWLIGYLSISHIMPYSVEEVSGWMENRRKNFIKNKKSGKKSV